MSPPPQATLGRYAMKERIATGGMGEVWRAEDTVLHREVAVKLLKSQYADDPRFRERFEIEARHAAALHHPNVATIFDYGEDTSPGDGGPRPYLVMELVEGRPLSALIRPGEPMPAPQARSLIGQAAEAIAAAHAAGIVHRDVKPANLLVTPTGQVKVTDFGIARAADQVALTGTGEVIGTPHYLSPEQASGKTATPASDVYALGVVLYECLTGTRPYSGDTPLATALAHIRAPLPDLPADVPADLARITRRALAKDPAARYLDAAAMAAALRGEAVAAASGPDDEATRPTSIVESTSVLPVVPAVPVPAVQVGPVPPVDPPAADIRRRRGSSGPWWLLAGLAVLATVVVIAALLLVNQNDQTPATSPDPPSPSQSQQPPSPTESGTQSSSESPSPTPTPAPSHTITAGDYVGLPVAEATQKLHDLGYQDVRPTTTANPGDQPAGTVADVAPTGEVPETTPIVLSVWGDPANASPSATVSGNRHGPGPGQAKTLGKDKPGHDKAKHKGNQRP